MKSKSGARNWNSCHSVTMTRASAPLRAASFGAAKTQVVAAAVDTLGFFHGFGVVGLDFCTGFLECLHQDPRGRFKPGAVGNK